MSEVKRYRAGDFVQVQAVSAADYDAALSQLAALREELATVKKVAAGNMELLERLADAERRNADMLNWLRQQARADKGSVAGYAFTEAYNALKKIATLNKPEEAKS